MRMLANEEPVADGHASMRIVLGMQTQQKHIRLDVPPATTTVKMIIDMVMDDQSIPAEEELFFLFNSEKVKKSETLASCGIKAGPGKVHCVVVWTNSEKYFKKLADEEKKKKAAEAAAAKKAAEAAAKAAEAEKK